MKDRKGAGTKRELQVLDAYREEGYVAFRTPASLGVCDVVAMRADVLIVAMNGTVYDPTVEVEAPEVLMVEVKANAGNPYMNFRKREREALSDAAKKAGAQALLVHWPPRGARADIPENEWPL